MESSLNRTVKIYTDGACSGNPGPGGWGVVLCYGEIEKELSGSESLTTNNRMELMAAIKALETLKNPITVEMYTDSLYVRDGVTGWIKKWKINGWKTANRQPVKNADLWKELDTLAQQFDITWHWVKAHNNHKYNERADFLARHAIVTALMQDSLSQGE